MWRLVVAPSLVTFHLDHLESVNWQEMAPSLMTVGSDKEGRGGDGVGGRGVSKAEKGRC